MLQPSSGVRVLRAVLWFSYACMGLAAVVWAAAFGLPLMTGHGPRWLLKIGWVLGATAVNGASLAFQCDTAVLIARVGLRGLVFELLRRRSWWPGSMALANLSFLVTFLLARRYRILVLILPQVIALTFAVWCALCGLK